MNAKARKIVVRLNESGKLQAENNEKSGAYFYDRVAWEKLVSKPTVFCN